MYNLIVQTESSGALKPWVCKDVRFCIMGIYKSELTVLYIVIIVIIFMNIFAKIWLSATVHAI